MTTPPHRSGAVVLAVLTFSVVATVAALAGVGGAALLGFDCYPLIAASKVGSLGDLFGTFGEELMDGRYPDGRFYRPLVHLSFAFDHATGGLCPLRYFATDLTIAALAGWAIGLVAAELTGPGRSTRARLVAGLVATAAFVLHRAQLDVVPYAARRADALAILFVALTALAASRGARAWLVALPALLALLSKESGVVAVPVAFVFAVAREGSSARDAARTTLAPLVAIAGGIALRTAVLGGLGGHAESGAAGVGSAGAVALGTWRALTAGIAGGPWVLVGLLLGTALPLAARGRAGRTAVLAGLAWSASALAITLVAGRFHDWYALAVVPGIAVVAGVSAGRSLDGAGVRDRLTRLAAIALVLVFASASRAGDPRGTLRVAATIAADQVERFRATVEALEPGSEARFEPWVFAVAARPGAPPIFVHAPYSLAALGDLTLAGPRVTAVDSRRPVDAALDPGPDGVLVRLVPGPPPAVAVGSR
ncbi:MAG: hypothetical protein AAGB93_01920 [Planctomycetota bacterium]